jgi:hypothetical protein
VSKQAEKGNAQVRSSAGQGRHRVKIRSEVDRIACPTEALKPCRAGDLQAIPDQLVDIDHHNAALVVTAHKVVNVTNHLTGLNTGVMDRPEVLQCGLIVESVQEQLHPTADRCHRIVEIVNNPGDEDVEEVRPLVLDIQVAVSRHGPSSFFALTRRRKLPPIESPDGISHQQVK